MIARRFLLFILFGVMTSPLHSMQLPLLGVGAGAFGAGYAPITIGVHNNATCASTTSCGVAVGTPSAGSVIYCVAITQINNAVVVSDSVNSGNYQPLPSRLRDANHDVYLGGYYKENVAASATTVTVSGFTSSNSQIACEEVKGTRATYTVDSNVIASLAGSGANPNSGTTITPTSNNEIVFSGLYRAATPTAGTNFTLIDGSGSLWPEYWIQTTATATNGPFTVSASYNAVAMTAFARNAGGSCSETMIFDWSGAVNTTAVSTTNLAASTHGGAAQANADGVANPPGWNAAGSGITFTTNSLAYSPLANSRTCPFYSGLADGSGLTCVHCGLQFATSTGAGTGGGYYFQSNQPNASLWACVATDTPVSHNGTIDVLAISGGDNGIDNPDYVNLQMNSNGATTNFALEHLGGGATVYSTTQWAQNTKYGIRMTYKQAGLHTIEIYNGCGNNPTKLETLTSNSAVSGGGTADKMALFGNANSYATGTNFFVGAVALDTLYGAAILP